MKVGLIAMGGVCALNPELLALGLTMPGVVERSNVLALLSSFGLLTLAGCTPVLLALDTAPAPVGARTI